MYIAKNIKIDIINKYMKLAVRILSYTVGAIMLMGAVSLASDGDLDVYTLIAFMIMESQVILTLIYINDK